VSLFYGSDLINWLLGAVGVNNVRMLGKIVTIRQARDGSYYEEAPTCWQSTLPESQAGTGAVVTSQEESIVYISDHPLYLVKCILLKVGRSFVAVHYNGVGDIFRVICYAKGTRCELPIPATLDRLNTLAAQLREGIHDLR